MREGGGERQEQRGGGGGREREREREVKRQKETEYHYHTSLIKGLLVLLPFTFVFNGLLIAETSTN